MKLRSRYSERVVVKTKIKGKSRTHQSFKEECDINTIMKRYNKTGMLPDMIRQDARYGDFTDVPRYEEALNTVILAQEQFNALSAKVRDRFNNDPVKFLAFASDARNKDEMIALGMALPSHESASLGAQEGLPKQAEQASAAPKA